MVERSPGRSAETLHGGRELRRAYDAASAATAVAILREAARWAAASGIDVWRQEELRDTEFARAASAGELVLGYESGTAAATMLLQARDPVYWPDDPPGEALYVHKVAVRRASAGSGWLSALIAFAERDARERAIPYLRLDTVNRPRMRRMYEELGFRWIPEEPLQLSGREFIRLERRL